MHLKIEVNVMNKYSTCIANKPFWRRLTVLSIGAWLLLSCLVSLVATFANTLLFFAAGSIAIAILLNAIPWVAETCVDSECASDDKTQSHDNH